MDNPTGQEMEKQEAESTAGVEPKFRKPAKPSEKPLRPPRQYDPGACVHNLQNVCIGTSVLKAWYYSPYPDEYKDLSCLYVCDSCLEIFESTKVLNYHQNHYCKKTPPGVEIYRDGDISMFEVDGRKNKRFCQLLCLFIKLFLEAKQLFYEIHLFLFYVMTKRDNDGLRIVGCFSKQKLTFLGNNVSCIMTMPQYHRQGFGRFMIEFSYLLTRKAKIKGTPEKPLSELGRLTYKSYWRSAILEYLHEEKTADNELSISSISIATGMNYEDIEDTLESLGFLNYASKKNETGEKLPYFHVDWEIVASHQETIARSPGRLAVKEDCLTWPKNDE